MAYSCTTGPWFLRLWGQRGGQVLTLQAATGADLCETLERAVKTTDCLVLLEVLVDRHDVPDLLEQRVESQK